jgi:nitrogen fixation NifU-like protein
MDVYADNILDHYRTPRGKHPLPAPTVTREEINVSCGDALALSLLIKDGIVTKMGWDGTGCAISQAAMSMLSEELEGKSVADLEKLTKEDIYELLGVPIGPRRVKCALLSLHALKNALRKAKGEEVWGWNETIESA